jgi:hypothetical protein
MMTMKITQNPHEVPLSEDMIPIIAGDHDLKMIRVVADGYPGSCFLQDRGWNSTRIVIVFDRPHPTWGESFVTKHFLFERPGKMYWGHQGDFIRISAFLETVYQ